MSDKTLGKLQHKPAELELKEGANPRHSRLHPMSKCHKDALQKEVNQSVELGALKRVNDSEWATPSFIIPKKDGTAHFINNFRKLNKWIQQKPCPVPNTQDMHAAKLGCVSVRSKS